VASEPVSVRWRFFGFVAGMLVESQVDERTLGRDASSALPRRCALHVLP
jgi:hypothetical protein